MDKEIADSAVRNLSLMLLTYPRSEITGSQLGELLSKNFPELNLRRLTNIPSGPGALTKFIALRLPGLLSVCGKSGADLVYNIKRGTCHPPVASTQDETLMLRQLVTHAVSRMSLDELRQISLPAGLAYDAVRFSLKS
jgi:hypothetical protein